MQMYTIVRKRYRSTKDMNPDNPYRVTDIWVGSDCAPLTMKEAEIVLPKMVTNKLWINQIVPVGQTIAIENKEE